MLGRYLGLEPQRDLLGSGFHGVGAVANVAPHVDAEVAAHGTAGRLRRPAAPPRRAYVIPPPARFASARAVEPGSLGGAQDHAASLDDTVAFPNLR